MGVTVLCHISLTHPPLNISLPLSHTRKKKKTLLSKSCSCIKRAELVRLSGGFEGEQERDDIILHEVGWIGLNSDR